MTEKCILAGKMRKIQKMFTILGYTIEYKNEIIKTQKGCKFEMSAGAIAREPFQTLFVSCRRK